MASEFTGICICLFLPPTVAQRLALPGGERTEDLHVTIEYFGDKTNISDIGIKALEETVAWESRMFAPIEASISGLAVFNSKPDEKKPLVALVNSQDILWLRTCIDTDLEYNSYPAKEVPNNASEFPFTPHITLDYLDPASIYLPPIPTDTSVYFDSITLAIGDERRTYPLTGQPKPSLRDYPYLRNRL